MFHTVACFTSTTLLFGCRQKQAVGKLAVEDANTRFYDAFMSGQIQVRPVMPVSYTLRPSLAFTLPKSQMAVLAGNG